MENDVETGSINKDILAGEWTQIRGELKTWWGDSPMMMFIRSAVKRTS